jgi:hypothetical protein
VFTKAYACFVLNLARGDDDQVPRLRLGLFFQRAARVSRRHVAVS